MPPWRRRKQAQMLGLTIFHDLDLRPDQWSHPRAYGTAQRTLWAWLNVVIGTEEEFFAALALDADLVMAGERVAESQKFELMEQLPTLFSTYPTLQALILKRGPDGVTVFTQKTQPINVAGFPVEVVNTVGAGDAFASGLIYGWAQGWAWPLAARFANACGALVVTRHGCAAAMPTLAEVEDFLGGK